MKEQLDREHFIARIRHIAWVAYQIAAGQPYNEEINDDQMKSLLIGIKFQDEHPGNSPEQNHENWMKMKISQGWKYGPVKSFEEKTHPDLIPYLELPEIEKRKDASDTMSHKLAAKLWDDLEIMPSKCSHSACRAKGISVGSKRTIFNPVTDTSYEVHDTSTKYGTKGEIKGIWRQNK